MFIPVYVIAIACLSGGIVLGVVGTIVAVVIAGSVKARKHE